jgi:hypothetical protein
MLAEFHSAVDRLAPMLEAEELLEVRRSGEQAERRSEQLQPLGAALVEIFASSVRSAFSRAGIDQRIGNEVSRMFASAMSFFAEASRFDHVRCWAPAIALSSANPNPWAKLAGKAVVFDVTHADILRSRVVARDVDRLLARARPLGAR